MKKLQNATKQFIDRKLSNDTRQPSLEALEAIINAFRENGLETTLEDLVKVKM